MHAAAFSPPSFAGSPRRSAKLANYAIERAIRPGSLGGRLSSQSNDLEWSVTTIADGNKWLVSVGIQVFTSSYAGLDQWGPMLAGFVIASLALIVMFEFTMPYYVAGLTSGAIKA